MRSSRFRHCLRQCSTPRPSPDNLAFAAHDLCVGSADACNGAGDPIPASRAPRFARPADCGGSARPSELGEIDAGQPDIRTSAPCRQVRVLQMCLQGSEDWLYCTYFPEAKSRDFADLWPPDAIISEMTSTGFTGVEAERRHVHRERDLAELWSVVGSTSGNHNCCHYRTLRIRPACGASNATSTIRRRPGRAPTTCAHRGGRRHCKIAPIGQQHSPRRGCSARRRFASPRGSRCFSGRGIPGVSPIGPGTVLPRCRSR